MGTETVRNVRMAAKLARYKIKLAALKAQKERGSDSDDDKDNKRREAEKLVFKRLPTYPDFRNWNNATHRTITTGSGRPKQCNIWLLDNVGKSFEELADVPKKWQSIDDKMAVAYLNICEGPLGIEINYKAEEEKKHRRMITGSQIKGIIDNYYCIRSAMDALYDMNDLQLVKFTDDSELALFRYRYRDCIQGFKNIPTTEQWERSYICFPRSCASPR